MPRFHIAATIISVLFVLACVILGCGGGGGGSSSGGLVGFTRVEAVLGAVPLDTQNIVAGDVVQFELVNYDPAGARNVIPGTLWATTDVLGLAGLLDPSTGILTATASSGSTAYTISTTFQNVTYSAPYLVTPVQARIRGKVSESFAAVGIPGAKILFYDATPSVVGKVTSAYDGTFYASVPTSAVRFSLDSAGVPVGFFGSFSYSGMKGRTSGTSSGLNTSTTLNDTSLSGAWTTNEAANHPVTITSGTGLGQTRTIGSNTSSQLTVTSAWATIPDATSTYSIDTLMYSATVAGCSAPLPSGLANGAAIAMPTSILLYPNDQPPPPPPDGCP